MWAALSKSARRYFYAKNGTSIVLAQRSRLSFMTSISTGYPVKINTLAGWWSDAKIRVSSRQALLRMLASKDH
jgi:hypothetical protein